MSPPPQAAPAPKSADRFRTVRALGPYLWPAGHPNLKRRVVLAIAFLILAKVVTIVIPFMYAWTIDALQPGPAYQGLSVALGLILAYGVGRIMMQAFAQLRDAVFAKVAYRAVREVAIKTFRHIHALSLRFHLEKRTGGLNRQQAAGTQAPESQRNGRIPRGVARLYPTRSRDNVSHPDRPTGLAEISGAIAAPQEVDLEHGITLRRQGLRLQRGHAPRKIHFLGKRVDVHNSATKRRAG